MGVMRFLVYPEGRLRELPEARQAYLSGFDGRVFPTRVELDGNVLVCRRQTSESCRLHVAWPVPGVGRPLVSTASLREQDVPYLLPVELARGKLGQVRNQAGAWENAGMDIPADFDELNRESLQLFARAASLQEEPAESCRLADEAIERAHAAAECLTRDYVAQRLAIRRRRSPQFPASLGCSLGRSVPDETWTEQLCGIFDAVAIPLSWRWIEPVEGEYHWECHDAQLAWCLANRLLPRGGPLLDFSPDGLPGWLSPWEGDALNLQSFVCDFVETALSRYAGRIRTWEITAAGNTGGVLGLDEESRLALIVRALNIAHEVAEVDQLLIRVQQPWGGYQAQGQHLLSPMQFVDALIRCGTGLSGINLEISVGVDPGGSELRDLMDLSRLIDLWSALGLPLHITLAFPSSTGADPHCDSGRTVPGSPNGGATWSETAQAKWIDGVLPLLLAKQSVAGIFWSELTDADLHEFPHGGLTRPDGTPKPVLECIRGHRFAQWTAT